MFLFELEIFGVAVQGIHQKSKKKKKTTFTVSVKNFLVKLTLRLFSPLSVVTTMVQTLLRQLRRALQIKKIMANAPFACYSLLYISKAYHQLTAKKAGYCGTSYLSKKTPQKLHRKRGNNWPVMGFIHSASEIRIYRESSGNKLHEVYN